jgi:hypothetical protein
LPLFECASQVQLKQASQDVVTDLIGPAVAVFLPAGTAILVFVLLVFKLGDEFAAWLDVGPAIGIENGAVHGIVHFAEARDVCTLATGVVEPVIDGGKTFVLTLHLLCAEVTVSVSGSLKRET